MTRSTTRPYVRVQVAWTTAPSIRCRANVALHIAGENGGSVDIKAGEVFYLVRSDSNDGSYYVLRYIASRWFCTCPATKPCKHEINAHAAALTRYLARKVEAATLACPRASTFQEQQRTYDIRFVPKPLAEAERRRTASFGTRSGSQGFSLLR